MAETSFTPYWRALETPTGPNSWIFFAVAKFATGYQPVAAISSVGMAAEESLQGSPLVVCCQRIVTIFSDSSNQTAIRGELALADAYYQREANRDQHREPVELPYLTRRHPGSPLRFRPWDRTSVVPFPFISAALLHGVAFDPRWGRGAPVRPEPLETVYRDTDVEWGMVVVDITDLERICYGIVGFGVAMAKFVPSLQAEKNPFSVARHHLGEFEEGPLRVMDEVRPRRAMSAAEYMERFRYTSDPEDYYGGSDQDLQVLQSVSLVDATAFDPVWPAAESSDMSGKPQSLSIQQEQETKKAIEQTLHTDDFDESVLDHVCHLPGFNILVQEVLQGYDEPVDNTRALGRLIRLACTRQDGHLGMELLDNFTVATISAAFDDGLKACGTITSLSLCIDSVRGTPAELATVLSRQASLKEICLLQHPTRDSDRLSVQVLEALATETDVLSRVNVVFAGAYSSALREKFWLPDSPSFIPRQIFPLQQIFVRHQCERGRSTYFEYNYIHLEDGLLRPEQFAAGFLLWLSTLEPASYRWFDGRAPFLSFSSAPATLASDLLSSAHVTPILCENLAIMYPMPDGTVLSPRARDFVPGGWTVLVSQELIPGRRASDARHIRYAFVRMRAEQSIAIENPPEAPPGLEMLEVASLKAFLSISVPHVEPSIVDASLEAAAKTIIAQQSRDEPWASGVDPLSVLREADAAALLVDFLRDAKDHNRRLPSAIEKYHGSERTLR